MPTQRKRYVWHKENPASWFPTPPKLEQRPVAPQFALPFLRQPQPQLQPQPLQPQQQQQLDNILPTLLRGRQLPPLPQLQRLSPASLLQPPPLQLQQHQQHSQRSQRRRVTGQTKRGSAFMRIDRKVEVRTTTRTSNMGLSKEEARKLQLVQHKISLQQAMGELTKRIEEVDRSLTGTGTQNPSLQ